MQDLIDYGFEPDNIGMVFAERKQWDRPVTISTWQSLSRNHKKLIHDCIIVDETHQSKSVEIKKILQKAKKAKYRLGFTGTMHSDELNNWNTKAYLGPIIREYSSGFLAEEGYISKAVIHMMNIEYRDKWKGDYFFYLVRAFRGMAQGGYQGKKVRYVAMDGNFIKEFVSSREANRRTGVCQSRISHCCLGKCEHAGKFIWRYKH